MGALAIHTRTHTQGEREEEGVGWEGESLECLSIEKEFLENLRHSPKRSSHISFAI